MLRKFAFLSAAAVAAALAATPSMAGGPTNAPVASPDFGPTPGPLYPPYAQAEAYIGQACAVVANKNFTSVTHPIAGVCCLTLAPGIELRTTPVVTVEWGRSLGVALFSQYDFANVTCPKIAGVLEVRNYKGDTGGVGSALKIPALSDQVAFFITVP